MIRTTTQEDLIRLIYQETDSAEATVIQNSIEKNWSLKQDHEDYLYIKRMMDKSFMYPSMSSVDKVLDHIRA